MSSPVLANASKQPCVCVRHKHTKNVKLACDDSGCTHKNLKRALAKVFCIEILNVHSKRYHTMCMHDKVNTCAQQPGEKPSIEYMRVGAQAYVLMRTFACVIQPLRICAFSYAKTPHPCTHNTRTCMRLCIWREVRQNHEEKARRKATQPIYTLATPRHQSYACM